MTKKYFNSKLDEIEINYRKAKEELIKEYAYANNPYKIGDIVTDHIGSIKIESIKVYVPTFMEPSCVYFGLEYTKKGQPNKRGNKRKLYQVNIISPISPLDKAGEEPEKTL